MACWTDYEQIGMKDKGGKSVPNCVPKRAAAKEKAQARRSQADG